jgi:hypothetical protein
MASLIQKIRGLWFAATGRRSHDAAAASAVIVHDPAGQRPHDLDDPFFDAGVQSRIADVIAHNAAKKPRN